MAEGNSLTILDKVRRWIDGETSELVLEEAARDAQVKPRSKAEEFIVKIAREVESVMQNEMVPLPQGTTIIPSEYTIFLSTEDDKEWKGVKRKGLEQGLYHILAERAREIAGKRKLETKSFVIELRIDGTMEKGEVRVQHSWEDSNANKTGVLSRPKPTITSATDKSIVPPTDPIIRNAAVPQAAQFQSPSKYHEAAIGQAEPLPAQDVEEMTRVNSRRIELYKLEVWRSGVRQNVVPIYQREIVIGRGSKSKPVDIPLNGDVEVSRRHLTLSIDDSGRFWAVNEGKNPASINNQDLPSGQRVALEPGVPLQVCSYMLRIQPA
jgi:hypothetical protein